MREAGIEDTLDTILAIFAGDAPGRFNAIELAVRSGNPSALKASAHAFKGAAASIRAVTLADLLSRLESAGLESSLESAPDLLTEARGELEAVMRAIARIRNTGSGLAA